MMTDLPPRITLSRAKGWRLQDVAPGAVKVDRGGKGLFGNPWIVGNPGRVDLGDCVYNLPGELTAAHCKVIFKHWLMHDVLWRQDLPAALNRSGHTMARQYLATRRAAILAALPTLRGKPLACWCKPGCFCHADVLIWLANAPEQTGEVR